MSDIIRKTLSGGNTMEENKIRQRSEIPVEDKWAIEDLYATDAAWEAELETAGLSLIFWEKQI
jgi:hypothetical protein